MDNPEKLAQMLQQQQAMKFLQSMQGGQGAMTQADAMQAQQGMAQQPMSDQGAIAAPQVDYGMPMPQQSYSASMPTAPQMGRREMLQGAVNSMGQGAMTNKDAAMMRRMPK